MQRLGWGGRVPDEAVVAWSARAIAITEFGDHSKFAKVTGLDLLPDRQATLGEKAQRDAFCAWLNERGLPELRKAIIREDIRCGENRLVIVHLDQAVMHANPNASYGYVYVCAWRTEPMPFVKEKKHGS